MALNYVTDIDDRIQIQNVLVSVYNKEGLDVLVNALTAANPTVKFYATGNTHRHIRELLGKEADHRLIAISDYTGQPEMQGGLVKTLDFKIYLGLLSETYNEAHRADMERTHAVYFDMVISNLYPFGDVVTAKETTPENARGNIDIGGPCLIRAGAKNYHRVAVVTDRNDYRHLAGILESSRGTLDLETRYTLARKAFLRTAEYDTVIAEYFLNTGTEAVKRCYRLTDRGGRS